MATLLSNAPAEPAVLFAECVEDLLLEARNFLDGEPITNEQQAEGVSSLLNRLRRVSKDADEARKLEKKPHDDAAKAVQAKWSPIIDKATLAATTAKQALAPYLKAIEERQQREAQKAREEADRLAEIARTAHAEASGNLQASEDAERLLKAAKAAEKDAARAGKAKAHATGGERAVGLRSVWSPTLTDPCAALKFYRERNPTELKIWLQEQAERDVRAGARSIPGFEVTEARVAV
jgi:type IV secretory pathway VirB10-like protein